MRLAFLGTPGLAVPFLTALIDAGHEIALVVTQADKRRGRGGALVPTPVKEAAVDAGLRVTHRVADVIDAGVELGVVVAFGRLVRPNVLAAVPMVNVHFSLLPRWRGAAPVERAILVGDIETGVCLMQLEEGLDTGPVYACERVTIGDDETLSELRGRLVDHGVAMIVGQLDNGLGEAEPQQGEATYAEKIDPEELRIDWTRPADAVHRLIRLEEAWTTFRSKRLKILRARRVEVDLPAGVLSGLAVGCGDNAALELVVVQPEGRARQDAAAWRNGARPQPGEVLGT